ncbi:MAG: DUF1549 domain-containing protein, partial [Bacteroidota bacterium]|nr:DUF1549 domain-containing protein [Bacteroidota bacterium]
MRHFFTKTTMVVLLLAVVTLSFIMFTKNERIDYSTQVKPIINKNCITCHGGVRAKGNFSLLFRDDALAKTKDGKYAIIPGDPDGSEMIQRLSLKDPEERMPFHHQPLTKEEIGILRKWIKQGAQWGENWSYVALQPVAVPQPKSFFGLINTKTDWAENEVDYFILDKLKEQNLQPSPQADKQTLLRRVSLDIIGELPSKTIADQYLNDN